MVDNSKIDPKIVMINGNPVLVVDKSVLDIEKYPDLRGKNLNTVIVDGESYTKTHNNPDKVFVGTFENLDKAKDDHRDNLQAFIQNTLTPVLNFTQCDFVTLDVVLSSDTYPNYPEGTEDLRLPYRYELSRKGLENVIEEGKLSGRFSHVSTADYLSNISTELPIYNKGNIVVAHNEEESLNGKDLKLILDLNVGNQHVGTVTAYGINKENFDNNSDFILEFLASYSKIMDSYIDLIYHTMLRREHRIIDAKTELGQIKKSEQQQSIIENPEPLIVKVNDIPGRGYVIPSEFDSFVKGYNPAISDSDPKLHLINGIGRYSNLSHNFTTIFGNNIDNFYRDKTDLNIILFNTMLVDLFCLKNGINGTRKEDLLLVASSALAPPYLFFLDKPNKQKELFQDMSRATNLLSNFFEQRNTNYKGARGILSEMDNIIGNSPEPSVDFLELARRYSVMVFDSRFEFGGVKEFMQPHTVKNTLYHLPHLILRERDIIEKGPENYQRKAYGKAVFEFIEKHLAPLVCEPDYDYRKDFRNSLGR